LGVDYRRGHIDAQAKRPPPGVDQVLRIGAFAILLVLLLWLAQWWFPKVPELRRRWAEGRRKALEKKQQRKTEKRQKDTTEQESPDSDNDQDIK